jgi:hypothetical protein
MHESVHMEWNWLMADRWRVVVVVLLCCFVVLWRELGEVRWRTNAMMLSWRVPNSHQITDGRLGRGGDVDIPFSFTAFSMNK